MRVDQLQNMTYQLCFGHQIVYMPTSLPSPVYIANRYAAFPDTAKAFENLIVMPRPEEGE